MMPNLNRSRKPFPLPVVALGPGAQSDDAPEFPEFPKEMHTFAMPRCWALPEDESADAAVAWLEQFYTAITQSPGGPVVAAVDELSESQRRWIEDAFGVGEVVAQTAAPISLRLRESAFPGIWHEVVLGADGAVVRDEWRYAPYSAALIDVMTATSSDTLLPPDTPDGVMNGPALVEELRYWAGKGTLGRAVHVMNLTLLPLTPADLQMLNAWLGPPMVAIAIRSYGQCRVSSTCLRDVWRVQYFNSMDALILDTIEVTRLPEVVRAAPEDLALTRERLADYLAELAR